MRKSTSTSQSTQRRRWVVTDREEVQRLLSATVVAGYETPDGDVTGVSFEVDAATLAELCRTWLAVQDAPVGRIDFHCGREDGTELCEFSPHGTSSRIKRPTRTRVRIDPDPPP